MCPVFEITEEGRDPARTVSGCISQRTRITDEHRRPILLDEVLILGDSRDSRDACPCSSFLVIERYVDSGVVVDLVKLVGCVVCDEEEVDLRWRECCGVVWLRVWQTAEFKGSSRRHGDMALECNAPPSSRVTSMPTLALPINL